MDRRSAKETYFKEPYECKLKRKKLRCPRCTAPL